MKTKHRNLESPKKKSSKAAALDNESSNIAASQKNQPPPLSLKSSSPSNVEKKGTNTEHPPIQKFMGSLAASAMANFFFNNPGNSTDEAEEMKPLNVPGEFKESLTNIESSLAKMEKFRPILKVPPTGQKVKSKVFKGGVLAPTTEVFGSFGDGLDGIKTSLSFAKGWIDLYDGTLMEKEKAHEQLKGILSFTADTINFTKKSTSFVIDVVKKQRILNAEDLKEVDGFLNKLPDLNEGTTGKTLSEIADGVSKMAKSIGLITDVFTILNSKSNGEDIVKAAISIGVTALEFFAKQSTKQAGLAVWGGPLGTIITVIMAAYDGFKLLEEYFTKKTIFEGLDFILTDLKEEAVKLKDAANPLLVLEILKTGATPEESQRYDQKMNQHKKSLTRKLENFQELVKPRAIQEAFWSRPFDYEVQNKQFGLLKPGHMKSISAQFSFLKKSNLNKRSPEGLYVLTATLLEKVAYCMENIKSLMNDEFSYTEDEDKKAKVYTTEGGKKRSSKRKALVHQYRVDKGLYGREEFVLNMVTNPSLEIAWEIENKKQLKKDLKLLETSGVATEDLSDFLRKEAYKENSKLHTNAKKTKRFIDDYCSGAGGFAKVRLLVRIAHLEADPLIMYDEDGSLVHPFTEKDAEIVRVLMKNPKGTEGAWKDLKEMHSYFEESYNLTNLENTFTKQAVDRLLSL